MPIHVWTDKWMAPISSSLVQIIHTYVHAYIHQTHMPPPIKACDPFPHFSQHCRYCYHWTLPANSLLFISLIHAFLFFLLLLHHYGFFLFPPPPLSSSSSFIASLSSFLLFLRCLPFFLSLPPSFSCSSTTPFSYVFFFLFETQYTSID